MSLPVELPIVLLLAAVASAMLAPEHAAVSAATTATAPSRGLTMPGLAFVVADDGVVVPHPDHRAGECAVHARTLLADATP